jgi:hypothetical protein
VLWQAVLQQLFFRQYRPPYTTWTSRYFQWDMPKQLIRDPATFLSFSYRTASVLAPYVHPDSSHVNLLGQYTPNFDAPGSQRIRQLLDRHEHAYAIFDASLVLGPSGDWNVFKSYFRTQARFWGLDFTDRGCDLIVRRQPTGAWAKFDDFIRIKPPQPLAFVSCELRRSSIADRDAARAELSGFAKKLARLGSTCPNYFNRPLSYIRVSNTWTVTSFATFEMRLDFEDEGAFYLQLGRAPYVRLELGRIKGDQFLAYEPDCEKWLSRLSELAEEAAGARRTAP